MENRVGISGAVLFFWQKSRKEKEKMKRIFRLYFQGLFTGAAIIAGCAAILGVMTGCTLGWNGWAIGIPIGLIMLWLLSKRRMIGFMVRSWKDIRQGKSMHREILADKIEIHRTHETLKHGFYRNMETRKYRLEDERGNSYFFMTDSERPPSAMAIQEMKGRRFEVKFLPQSGLVIGLKPMIGRKEFMSSVKQGYYLSKIEPMIRFYEEV